MKYQLNHGCNHNLVPDKDNIYVPEFSFGTIADYAKVACNKTSELGKSIKFKFNGTVINVYKDSCYEDVCDKYDLLRNQK